MRCERCGPEADAWDIVCRGTRAYAGCVEGLVHLALETREAEALRPGEILVMPMTNPGAVPAMLRAGAVVTDRGGRLCHAAVNCREFQKPCIVGTSDATAALKTGDYVRVCSTEGVVRSRKRDV